MKKLYKKTFHTVLYLDEEDVLNESNKLTLVLTRFCGLSDSEPKEIKCIEDLPEGWNLEDSPTTKIRVDSDRYEYEYDIVDDTIGEILQDARLNSLEKENNKLKEENQKLQSLLGMLKVV